MTRFAPTLTLLAVAALGGGMFVANAYTAPTTKAAVAAPAAVTAPGTAPDAGNQISLADIPVVGATSQEISLASLPVVGATGSAAAGGYGSGSDSGYGSSSSSGYGSGAGSGAAAPSSSALDGAGTDGAGTDGAGTDGAGTDGAATGGGTGTGGTVISLADIPVVGATGETGTGTGAGADADASSGAVAGADPGTGGTVISLADIPVVGATGETGTDGTGTGGTGTDPVAGGPTVISLAGIEVVEPGAAGAAKAPAAAAAAGTGAETAFLGRTKDNAFEVVLAVQGGKAVGQVSNDTGIAAGLDGTVTGGALSLKSASGRTVLTAKSGAQTAEGTVTVDGTKHTFAVKITDAAQGDTIVGEVVQRLKGTG